MVLRKWLGDTSRKRISQVQEYRGDVPDRVRARWETERSVRDAEEVEHGRSIERLVRHVAQGEPAEGEMARASQTAGGRIVDGQPQCERLSAKCPARGACWVDEVGCQRGGSASGHEIVGDVIRRGKLNRIAKVAWNADLHQTKTGGIHRLVATLPVGTGVPVELC